MTAVNIRLPANSPPYLPSYNKNVTDEVNRAVGRTTRTLAAAESSTSTTPALIADANGDWAIPVKLGGVYHIRVIATYQTAATTTGGKINITAVTATGSIVGVARGGISASAVATELAQPVGALPFTFTTTDVSAIDTPHHLILECIFVCTADGSLEIRWGSEVGASAAQLNAGSTLIWEAF